MLSQLKNLSKPACLTHIILYAITYKFILVRLKEFLRLIGGIFLRVNAYNSIR